VHFTAGVVQKLMVAEGVERGFASEGLCRQRCNNKKGCGVAVLREKRPGEKRGSDQVSKQELRKCKRQTTDGWVLGGVGVGFTGGYFGTWRQEHGVERITKRHDQVPLS